MEKLLSIVIPTYNMSLYIERCINSLISDKTKDLLDILVINDGSKDDSSKKAKALACLYPDTIKVIDKENGNYGSCVNLGLSKAVGKYIKILDADDYMNTDALEETLEIMSQQDCDLILTDFNKLYTNKKSKLHALKIPTRQELQLEKICGGHDFKAFWMHSVAYKRSLFAKMKYHQTEGISYTDQEWIFLPLAMVRTVYYLPVPLYQYNLGREGQTVSRSFMQKHFNDHLVCIKSLLETFDTLPSDIPPSIKDMLYRRLFGLTKFVYKSCLIYGFSSNCYQELKAFDKYLKQHCYSLYIETSKIKLSSPVLPYHYIKHWRKKSNSKSLRYMIKLYKWKKRIF